LFVQEGAANNAESTHVRKSNYMMRQLIAYWTEERSLSAFLVLLVVQIFVIAPLRTNGLLLLNILNGVLCSLFLLAGLLSISKHRFARWLAPSVVVAALTVRWLVLLTPSYLLLVADSVLALVTVVAFTVVVFRQVYTDGPVSAHRVRGAIAAYLLLGYVFACAYRLLNYIVPDALTINSALVQQGQHLSEVFMYFSLVTLTTVGFGDVTAVHPIARSLVTLEAVIGTLYPAILLARLVSLSIEQEKR
jgi:hypothetical protein